MRELAKTTVVIMLAVIACGTGACAWDVEYEASSGLLPTVASPEWQLESFGAPISILDELLHIGNSPEGGADYRREIEAISTGVPVTMETRVRVLSTTYGAANLGISTFSGEVDIAIFPDHIVTSDRYYQAHTFWQDFTTFHTIRLVYDGNTEAHVLVDNQLAFSWTPPAWSLATGPPGGVSFGSYSSDSYWNYIRYSKEYLPIPEPSSLAGLGLALVGLLLTRRGRLR